MSKLTITGLSGASKTIDATEGRSVMENIRGAGFDELLALCGGCCSCATCHVIVHPDDFARLQPIGEDEDDLLSGVRDRSPTSRLSCQIKFDASLDGLRVTIAKED